MLKEDESLIQTPGGRDPMLLSSDPPKPAADRHLWQIIAVRDLLWIGLTVFLLWFGYFLRGVFTPVLIALLLAYLVNPIVRRAEQNWRVPRSITIAVLLVIITGAMAGFGAWLGPLLAEQASMLAEKAPRYLQRLGEQYGIEAGTVSGQLKGFISRFQADPMSIIQSVLAGTGQAFGVLGKVIGTTTQAALFTVLIPVYFFFFSLYFDRMTAMFTRFIPTSRKVRWLEIAGKMDQAVSGFFRGRLLIALVTGVLYAFGWLATDVPYWFLLGVITGFLTIVPYLSLIGWPLAVGLKYLEAVTSGAAGTDWLAVLLWPSVVYLAVQFVESWVLTPWVQSQSLDMSAVTVLIVVFIGGAVGGLYGLILAIPVAACIKILLQEIVFPHVERWAERH